MRILYLVPSVQHPTLRGALRHYEFFRALAERHTVTLLALSQTHVPEAVRAEIGSLAEGFEVFPIDDSDSRAGGPRGIRDRLAHRLRLRRAVRRMRERFIELLDSRRFEVVLFHGKDVYPVIEGMRDTPLVVDFCDATSMREGQRLRGARPWKVPWRLWRYLAVKRVEQGLLEHSRHLAFISPRDREAVLGPDSEALVIPNGIDLDFWTRASDHRQRNCLVFTGVMDYAPNEDAALALIETILPLLQPHLPGIELLVVGRDPTPALLEAGRRHPAVTVTGFVEDVRPYLERASLFVAPIRYASGLQNKILEALAMEVPVVTTPVVASGVRVDGDADPPMRVAQGAEDFAAAVLSLLGDDAKRSRLAAEGRSFVETHFDWTRSAAMLEALCVEAVGLAPVGQSEEKGRWGEMQ